MNFQMLFKPTHRWLLIGMAIATPIATALTAVSVSQSRQTSDFVAVESPTQSALQQVTALGRLEPITEVIDVSVPAPLANDRVAELLIQRGDQVEAKQVIAVMESRDRLQNDLLEAQAEVDVAQAELGRIKAGAQPGEIAAQQAEVSRLQRQLAGDTATNAATINRYQAEVKTAAAEYTRYLSLYRSGATSESELERRQLVSETAQARLDEARAEKVRQIETVQAQISQAKANLNRISEVRPVDVEAAQALVAQAAAAVKRREGDLASAYVRTPIAGRVLDLFVQPGEVVAEAGIAAIGQTDQMQVIAEVYQTDIRRIYSGQPATITSESLTEPLDAVVAQIGWQVLPQEVTSGEPGENLDQKVVQVRVHLSPEDSQQVANLTNLQVTVGFLINRSAAQPQLSL
ncbi:HlyD family efflux transporter periplasmic adaptor subunit [cf. Phormidesmis sp. LEGE 11477]|uniref:HlyD family efflux transporter periplasmic adaptor subunit n=1 Tax=cf. Phormidesmis sp. LEGE 11477 TaxID=1828680 RepID=UPI0018814F09|nr:HlyD family efflux transporter periplasmic adaptor subunit [cf. Phormidesmis sp. LEGE 11477]MBE9060621.1 HlyD family efflux transporter periplasmic adaptor subunit [cf. Phormidesmis sp. LEGE 11477]